MKQFIREYFTFHKREQNGIFVLLFLIVLLIVYLDVSERCSSVKKIDFAKFEKEIQALDIAFVEKKTNRKESHLASSNAYSISSPAERFKFNPNNLSERDWKRLGLNDKQIRSIKNYELKGGTFRTKEDVKKMYAISSAMYLSLQPYIDIPSEQKLVTVEQTDFKNKIIKKELLELNTADSLQLIRIQGIGPFFAKSIINYRKALGGYFSKEQLLEVWKFDKEKYEAVEQYFEIDTSKIMKININTCTAEELKHPYISKRVANGIVNYRNKHGNFTTLEELKKTDLLKEEQFLKMAFYLNVGN